MSWPCERTGEGSLDMWKGLVHRGLLRITGEEAHRGCRREPDGTAGENRTRSGQDRDKTNGGVFEVPGGGRRGTESQNQHCAKFASACDKC